MYIVIYSILDVEGQTGKKFLTLSVKPSLNKVFNYYYYDKGVCVGKEKGLQ